MVAWSEGEWEREMCGVRRMVSVREGGVRRMKGRASELCGAYSHTVIFQCVRRDSLSESHYDCYIKLRYDEAAWWHTANGAAGWKMICQWVHVLHHVSMWFHFKCGRLIVTVFFFYFFFRCLLWPFCCASHFSCRPFWFCYPSLLFEMFRLKLHRDIH